MIDLKNTKHHKAIEEISDILAIKTGNKDKTFFRLVSAYFLAKIPASMKASIKTKFMGKIPINVYTIALATSGFGKGTSVNIIEESFLEGFKERFISETFPYISESNLLRIAIETAALKGKDEQDELTKLEKEFERLGPPNFTFDSGSVPATKQLRDKFLLADLGSINLQIDEFGSNLSNNQELLTCFLELYDKGKIKQKLTKQSNDNKRSRDLSGETPANILLFGTPSKLLDGSKTEQDFYNLLETGYARRCFFAHGFRERVSNTESATEIYNKLSAPKNAQVTSQWYNHFQDLADPINHKKEIELTDQVGIALIEYKIACERKADELSEFADIQKAELSHRYFKALKLAGVFAFIDEDNEISLDNLHAAIKLTEESGKCFEVILNRESNYVKLAKYIASVGDSVTHADLHEALPFYKSSGPQRKELISLATSWGYRNCVVIKSEFVDGIEFFSGEALKETDTTELILSVSDHFAYNYEDNLVTLEDLNKLASINDMHWTNHSFKKNHRAEANADTGFNLLVLDVDNGHLDDPNHPSKQHVSIDLVTELFKEYTYFIYTTKRHTDDRHRFRLVLPIKYILHLNQDEYKEFMQNIYQWLPFEIDASCDQRSKKWLTNESDIILSNEATLLDPVAFIPKTSKNTEMKKELQSLTSLTDVERWFVMKMSQEGSRNNNFIKYALMLKDSGMNYVQIESSILEFNKKLPNPLTEKELRSTVLITLAKRFTNGK